MRAAAAEAAAATAVGTAADEFISQSTRVISMQTQQRHFLSAFLSLLVSLNKHELIKLITDRKCVECVHRYNNQRS